jgi:DNA-binding protein H-NS
MRVACQIFDDLNSISMQELWALHEEIASILSTKMEAEKLRLQKRLEQLEGKTSDKAPERRPYPKVYPKYRNPNPPHQSWSGRGKQPKWIREWLAEGNAVEDLQISPRSPNAAHED